ncbi:MAG TPA: hypothetical protein ENH62_10145 [Marinobacter sp.]|uniref:DUF551 domain-containing protein n=1 Tax=marine sediment metagenome TaxID=412755 RepID=A0A0F9MHE2_9ZZZZ|nr:hypothetical protein [Marinobacter sp.]
MWQPIETAKIDGTVMLLTNGILLGAGCRDYRIEPDWTFRGYVEGQITDAFTEKVPNPRAGERVEWWSTFGCSAFTQDTDVEDYDGSLHFEPTHWMPLEPPVSN